MCKKKQFKYCPSTIDDCMKKLIDNIQWLLGKDFGSEEKIGSSWKIVACCCGHSIYPMTIICESPHGKHLEIVSNKYIPRKRNFYKKDEQGYYYIPETLSVEEASNE